MSLRNQPYLPLYVEDFLTDEKLIFCSAATTGVYIRLMCLMHKSEEYGKILLKQKFKQTSSTLKNFASQLAVQLPYDYQTILFALEELTGSKVLQEEPCAISQRRMVKDNEISEKRALAGKKGGDRSSGKKGSDHLKTHSRDDEFASNFAQAKTQANSEYESEYKDEYESRDTGIGGMGEKGKDPETPDVENHGTGGEGIPEVLDELSFENVWAMYGRKGNRKTGLRRWNGLSKKAKKLAVEHIPRYADATPDIRYRKNFETYLNQEAWNDEIISNKSNENRITITENGGAVGASNSGNGAHPFRTDAEKRRHEREVLGQMAETILRQP